MYLSSALEERMRRDEPAELTERQRELLAVLREAAAYNHPTAEIEEILRDIDRGRVQPVDLPPG